MRRTPVVVTDIIEVTKAKSRVFLDGEFAFVLYKGELRLYKLRKGEEVLEETVDEIFNRVLPKRAKKRSLMLLEKRDYTEMELRRKLQDGEYPQKAIDEAIDYVKSFRYIDDERYCRAYINCYASKWSKQQITMKLLAKGVDKHLAHAIYEELLQEGQLACNEEELIQEILRKKQYNPQSTDYKQRQKLYQHLLYKGFSMEQIKHVLGEFTNDFS
jgi:regulatory protein